MVNGTHPIVTGSNPHFLSNSNSLPAPSLEPPRYSFIFNDSEDPFATVQSGTSSPANYAFPLLNANGPTKGQPWATLHLHSRHSRHSNTLPKFFGGDNISGTIDLNLPNPKVINSINVVLKGRLIVCTAWLGPFIFLEERHTIWEKSNGDPRLHIPTRRFDGRLSGDYKFPFSFPFPNHVDLSLASGGKGKISSRNSLECPTPPTMIGATCGANVEYEFILQITHGLLRPDSKLKTIVIYIPHIVPTPASPLRQNAYLEGTWLPGPDRDPDGWFSLPNVDMLGRLSVAHFKVDVQCTLSLSLANPLSYTRGTVIPCDLTLSCQNWRTLEYLADHIYVRLVQTIRYFEDAMKGLDDASRGREPEAVSDITEVGLAVWWPSTKDTIENANMRRLQGEIHLPSDLLPSSDFLPLCISYAVQILPFDTKSFEYTPSELPNPINIPILQSYPVTIATVNGSGPIATAFTEHVPFRRKREIGHSSTLFKHYGSSGGMTGGVGAR